MTLFGPRLDPGARRGELAQPLFPPLKFFRDRKAIGKIGLIGRFGLRHQSGHLGLQLRFDVTGMRIGQRTVPAGIGVDLGPVKPNRAQLQNPDLPCQNQHLHKQALDLWQKSPPKCRYCIVIGMIVRGNEAERHRVYVARSSLRLENTPVA